MAVPLPASNEVASWQALMRRLARSFRHRAAAGMEGWYIFMSYMKFTVAYPQLRYRFGSIATWPVNGYATWLNVLAKVLKQGGATYLHGDLLTALTTMCNNLNESRYTT
jgi:hypothetical protein